MSNNLLSVSQVLAMAPGTKESPVWVDGGMVGICRRVDKKPYGAGKTMYPTTIADTESGEQIEVTFFVPPKFKEGDEVRFSGKGMRRGDYNGRAKLEIGKDTVVEARASAQQVQAAAYGAVAEAANEIRVNGQQVGMAMKEALALHTKHATTQAAMTELLSAPGFWHQVHTTASDIIRVGMLLEKGSLADPVRTRTNGHTTPARTAAPQRQAPAHDPERELVEEDVPF